MQKYKIIKERVATKTEVFNNLKNGGLKLLCENLGNKTISEVDWVPGGLIEIITVENNKIVAQYFIEFSYDTVESLNYTLFFKNKIWYIGHIED